MKATPPPWGTLDYVRIVVAFLGAIFSIVGALAPWVVAPAPATTTIALLQTCSGTVCVPATVVTLLAGGALLLIGFSKLNLQIQRFESSFTLTYVHPSSPPFLLISFWLHQFYHHDF